MRGFLADEALHLGAKVVLLFSRQKLKARSYSIDEELLAYRKAHRQRVEHGSAESVAIAPVPGNRLLHVDQQAAYDEFGH